MHRKQEQELAKGTASNIMFLHDKRSSYQKSWDNPQNGRKSSPAIQQGRDTYSEYRELKKLNNKIINDPINNWESELNRQFSKVKYKWLINTWSNI
jgi:hypothetical protein